MKLLHILISSVSMLAGAAIFLLAGEAALTAWGYGFPIGKPYVRNDVGIYALDHVEKRRYSVGWNFTNEREVSTNNQGFHDRIDYLPNGGQILVVGDSFMEARSIDPAQRMGAVVGRAFGVEDQTYTLARGGLNVPDYAPMMAKAIKLYHPKVILMLLHDDDFSGSFMVRDGDMGYKVRNGRITTVSPPRDKPHPPTWVASNRLPAYVVSNLTYAPINILRVFKADVLRIVESVGYHKLRSDLSSFSDRNTKMAMDRFAEDIAAVQQKSGVPTVIAIDCNHNDLYGDPQVEATPDDPFDYFATSARSRGLKIVDLKPAFERDWAARRQFLDLRPVDHHWNARAHRVAGNTLVEVVREMGIHFDKGTSALAPKVRNAESRNDAVPDNLE